MEILSITPYDRNTQLIKIKGGGYAYRVNSMQNPLYYLQPSGVYAPTNVASKVISRDRDGKDICLRQASIASAGFKVSDNAYKYFGLRPDCVQDGSEQLEFSIASIEFDGKPQTIDLSRNTAVNSTMTEIGPLVYVQSLRQRTRQLVRVNSPISTFKVTYQLDVTGLKLIVRSDIDEFWFYSAKTGDFRFRIKKPYLVDIFGNPHEKGGAVKHTLTDNKDGTYTYVKENTIDLAEVKTPYFIDADTVYSTTADGSVYSTQDSTWAALRGATSGIADNNDANHTSACRAYMVYGNALLRRSFFYFDLSSKAGTLISASVFIYGLTNGDSNVSIQQGTQSDTLGNADYNNFSGDYWAKTSSWSTSGYNTFALDATGTAAVQTQIGSGIFKVCAREYEHDYADSNPGSTSYDVGMYYADQADTTYDPYLLAALGPAGCKTINNLAIAYVKTLNSLEISNVKKLSGL